MRVLVTGGAGFIGSHVCARLVDMGATVLALDNFLLGSPDNVSDLAAAGSFELVEGDVSDVGLMREIMLHQAFDLVFHLAANSDIAKSYAAPDTDFTNTFKTTYAVLEAMRQSKARQLIFASSSAIYGEAPGRVREDFGPLLPISHYGAAKLASEAFISSYAENYGIRAWLARFPNVVGERSTHGAIYDFVRKLRRDPSQLEVLGDGTQIKPYLHVTDLVDALLAAWECMNDRINFFNVGGIGRCSVRRLAEIVVEESGRDARIRYTGGDRGWVGDVPTVDYDNQKLAAIGWRPRLDAEEAVRVTARWMLANTT